MMPNSMPVNSCREDDIVYDEKLSALLKEIRACHDKEHRRTLVQRAIRRLRETES